MIFDAVIDLGGYLFWLSVLGCSVWALAIEASRRRASRRFVDSGNQFKAARR